MLTSYIRKQFFFLIAAASFCGYANAQPNVTGVSISITSAGSPRVTITGSGFGSIGPNIVIRDNFENAQQSDGIWSRGSPTLAPEARSGNSSHLAYATGDQSARILGAAFGNDYEEVFVSFWVKLGTSYFPGSSAYGATSARSFPDNSSWKMAWVMDSEDGFRADDRMDQCIPTHTGNGSFKIAGNDGNVTGVGNDWWSWNGWMRISTWFRNVPGDYGIFQTLSQQHGLAEQRLGSNNPYDSGGTSTVSYMTMPGWMRASSDPVEVYYDDVYVAAGPGAAARVELSNSNQYSGSTTLEIAPKAIDWTDSRVVVEFDPNTSQIGTGFLFLTAADGSRNAIGFSLCDECPESPAPY